MVDDTRMRCGTYVSMLACLLRWRSGESLRLYAKCSVSVFVVVMHLISARRSLECQDPGLPCDSGVHRRRLHLFEIVGRISQWWVSRNIAAKEAGTASLRHEDPHCASQREYATRSPSKWLVSSRFTSSTLFPSSRSGLCPSTA